MGRDSTGRTILVAGLLCFVCSVMVAGAAVGLRDRQEANKLLDQKKNVLIAGGLYELGDSPVEIEEKFQAVEPVVIDVSTGEPVVTELVEEVELPEGTAPIDSGDLPGFSERAQYARIYEVMEDGQVDAYIFPIYGKGLWSTLRGYLALDGDLNTVRGITFYEHKETPGLGGEVENPAWKAKWIGKEVYDDEGQVALRVVKGQGDGPHEIDGLSGATITSNGVTNMINYWLGPGGFGPFIEKQRQSQAGAGDSDG